MKGLCLICNVKKKILLCFTTYCESLEVSPPSVISFCPSNVERVRKSNNLREVE